MRTTLDYVQGKQLNNASSVTPSGSAEVVTGLQIATGTNSGDFVELTDAQALALSKTSVGTLYNGIYQRVKLSSTVTALAKGQPLYWNASDTSDPYPVTNDPAYGGNTNYNWAGTVIDPSTTAGYYCWMQANGKSTVGISGAGAAGDQVTAPVTKTGLYVFAGTATTTQFYVGTQVAAGSASLALVQIGVGPTKV